MWIIDGAGDLFNMTGKTVETDPVKNPGTKFRSAIIHNSACSTYQTWSTRFRCYVKFQSTVKIV